MKEKPAENLRRMSLPDLFSTPLKSATSRTSGKSSKGLPTSSSKQSELTNRSFMRQQLSRKQYTSLKQHLKKTGSVYRDQVFPPRMTSLVNSPKRVPHKDFYSLRWVSLSQRVDDSCLYRITNQNPIYAGSLDGSFLLPLVNILNQHRSLIQQIFEDQSSNSECIYSVRMFSNGNSKYILIDDYYPFLDQIPLFVNHLENQIWPYILLKALAKAYGSFEQLLKGDLVSTFHQLTGFLLQQGPIKQLPCEGWSSLILSSGQQGERRRLVEQYRGPRKQFSFAVKRVKRFKDSFIFEFQDPFGTLNPLEYFRVPLESLQLYFARFYLLQLIHYQHLLSLLLSPKTPSLAGWLFRLDEDSDSAFSVVQKDKRFFPQNYQYSYNRLILCKNSEGKTQFLQASFKREKVNRIKTRLSAGDYLLIVLFDWSRTPCAYGLTFQSQGRLSVLDSQPDIQSYLQQLAFDFSDRQAQFKHIGKQVWTAQIIHQQSALAFQVFQNRGTRQVDLHKSYEKMLSRGAQLLGENNRQTKVRLGRGERKGVVLKILKEADNVNDMIFS